MVKEGAGLLSMLMGIMAGDSENLILPCILILIGAWLVLTSRDKGEH